MVKFCLLIRKQQRANKVYSTLIFDWEATQPLHHVAEALNGAVSLVGQLVSELLVTANLRFVAIHPVSPTILVVIV